MEHWVGYNRPDGTSVPFPRGPEPRLNAASRRPGRPVASADGAYTDRRRRAINEPGGVRDDFGSVIFRHPGHWPLPTTTAARRFRLNGRRVRKRPVITKPSMPRTSPCSRSLVPTGPLGTIVAER